MQYNNNQNYRNNGYSFGNSGNDRRYQQRVNNGNQGNFNNARPKKLNDCKLTMTKTATPVRCIVGWNYSKGKGLIAFVAIPSKKYPKKYKSKTGVEYTLFAVKLTIKRTLEERVFFALYSESTQKLIMDKIGFVADTRQHYFVTIKKK